MNLDALRRRHDDAARKAAERGVSGINYMPLKEGKNRVRILPVVVLAKDGDGTVPFFELGTHFSLGLENKRANCPRMTPTQGESGELVFGKFCPVCRQTKELFATKVDADAEIAKKIKGKERAAFLVIDRNEPEKGPKLMEVGPQIFEQILARAIDTADELGPDSKTGKDYDITDADNGRDFVITKGFNAGGFAEYDVQIKFKATTLTDDDDDYDNWLDQAEKFDFFRAYPVKSVEEIAAIMNDEEVPSETEAVLKTKKIEKAPKQRRTVQKEEKPEIDDDETEEPEESEDVEEEKPKKVVEPPTRRRPKVEAKDEEDEGEPEGTAPAKPERRRRCVEEPDDEDIPAPKSDAKTKQEPAESDDDNEDAQEKCLKARLASIRKRKPGKE